MYIIKSKCPTRDVVVSSIRSCSPNKVVDVIIGEPSANSRAALILLKDSYRKNEVDFYSKKYNVNINVFSSTSNYSLLEIIRKQFNRQFLKRKRNLICEYCLRPNLKLRTKSNNKIYATVDHKTPLIDICDWFNEENLAICCSECNNKKGDMTYNEWMELLNLTKS